MTAADTRAPRLGYIGLGNQGAPMAKRLLGWPGGLTVFDVRAEAMTPFVDGGATAAATLADVAAADIISVTVFDDAQVREVINGPDGLAAHAKPGTVIAIHSTISDTTAVELANELRPRGIHIADAPVSGGAAAAAQGELATMVGADEETFERITGPFRRWASLVIHAGEPGAGTRMKLARNMLTFVSYAGRRRGGEIGRGQWPEPAGAGQGGAPHRRPHRWSGGDHVPDDDGTDTTRRSVASGVAAHP